MPEQPNEPEQSTETQPPAPGGGRSLRDPGGWSAGMLSWLAILAVVGFLSLTPVVLTFFPGFFEEPTEGPALIEHTPPSGPLRLISKYSLGASQIAPGGEAALIEQVDALASSSPSDQLRAAIFAGAMLGPEAGLERLQQIEDDAANPPGDQDPKAFGPGFAEAFAIAETALLDGSDALSDAQRESIVATDGWFGELLLAVDAPEESAERAAIYDNANMVAMLLIVALLGLIGVGVVGLALFITAIVMLATGKLKRGYAPPAPGGSVYLETFALFLVSFMLVQLAAGVVYGIAGLDLSKVLVWLILPVMFWPLIRGADKAAWRHALGWHTGNGVFKEIGAGIIGYLAGLPIVAMGLACAVVLSILVSLLVELVTGGVAPPASHPAIDQIGSGGVLGVVSLYLLAAVWAPFFEETFFRGAFYHHMRGRMGVVLSALLVALIFAAIHPQGIGLIPGLMGLAVVFALLREWRGSIIAPIVAHSLHNATLMTILLLALS